MINFHRVIFIFRDEKKSFREMFNTKRGFDYDKAPPRGRLEGIRDFTHKPHYIKFYEGQPDTV